MADLDIAKASTTDLTNTVEDFTVDTLMPNTPRDQRETTYSYPDSDEYYSYYKTTPEYNRAIKTHAIWVTGRGIICDTRTKIILDSITGWGEDTFQSIMWNMEVVKKVLGDSFCEIIRDEKTNQLLNLKPLYTGDMTVVVDGSGIIKRYEHRTKGILNKLKKLFFGKGKFKPYQILHFCNDRFANEIHGISDTEIIKFVIDCKREAMADEKMIKHRELALGVLYVDTEDTVKRDAIMKQYANAVKNGEVLVLPTGTAELKDTGITPKERISWLQYLDNYFYRVVGVPKVLVEADASEAASKVGYMSYDPIFTKDQVMIEQDLWNQMAIRIKFKRPPTLHGVEQENEEKNTGQVGFQPNDTEVKTTRSE